MLRLPPAIINDGPRTPLKLKEDVHGIENRFSPGPADQRNQAPLRHPERSTYRCFLTDLAGFTDICRVGPDHADRQDRKKTGLFRLSPRNATILLLRRTDVNCFSILDL